MATISFHADDFHVQNLSGSGLGFYGGGFGDSVEVGEYQDTTFITDGNGTSQGPQVNNIKYLNTASGEINGAGSGVPLTAIPNYLATLNIRFSHGSAVKTQNAKLRIYDRSDIDNPASGVTTKVAEIIHPDQVQNDNGSGSTEWSSLAGSGVIMSLVSSPGTSGERPNGSETSDVRHDWYCSISASPDSIGSKTLFGLYFAVEYL